MQSIPDTPHPHGSIREFELFAVPVVLVLLMRKMRALFEGSGLFLLILHHILLLTIDILWHYQQIQKFEL